MWLCTCSDQRVALVDMTNGASEEVKMTPEYLAQVGVHASAHRPKLTHMLMQNLELLWGKIKDYFAAGYLVGAGRLVNERQGSSNCNSISLRNGLFSCCAGEETS